MNIKWRINEQGIKVKRCRDCKNELEYSSKNFYEIRNGKFSAYCIPCDRLRSKKYKQLHKKTDKTRAINNIFIINDVEYRRCSKCKEYFPNTFEYFDRSPNGQGGFRSDCRTCRLEYNREFSKRRWAYHLYNNARRSAQIHEWDIDITEEFILELYEEQEGKCYWLGVPMIPSSNKKSPFQPSLDRLDRETGYTKDNVVLCCFVANFGRNENSEDSWKIFLLRLKQELDYSQWQ